MLALAAVLLIWSRSAPTWWVYAATALVGLGYAGAQVFPMAMLPDAAAVDARRTGSNRAGVYTGVWTAGRDARPGARPGRLRARARRSAATGRPTDVDDFDLGHRFQPDSALTAIVLGFSLLPAVLILASLFFLCRYRLDSYAVEHAEVPA